ncbi:MAG: hypothetical protein ACK6CU_11095 [Deltaproteobacteria bacterium]|jgi:hypothetical protein
MQRPNTIFGLASHLVRVKWQALSPRGRTAAVIVAAMLGASGAFAVKAALGCGECCAASSGCPMAAGDAASDDGTPPCHRGR